MVFSFLTKLKLRHNHHNFREMILEIKVMIAKFDNVSQAMTAKKPAKKCVAHSDLGDQSNDHQV